MEPSQGSQFEFRFSNEMSLSFSTTTGGEDNFSEFLNSAVLTLVATVLRVLTCGIRSTNFLQIQSTAGVAEGLRVILVFGLFCWFFLSGLLLMVLFWVLEFIGRLSDAVVHQRKNGLAYLEFLLADKWGGG